MRKNIIILTIWLYFSSSLIINCGPIQSKLAKLVPSNAKAIQENQKNRALVAAGQGDGRAAAQAVIHTTASLARVQWLRKEWRPETFRSWFYFPKWSFQLTRDYGKHRYCFTSIACSPDGNHIAAGPGIMPIPVLAIDHTTGVLKRVNGPYEYDRAGYDAIAYSSDGTRAAALRKGDDSALALFDVDTALGKLTRIKDFKPVAQKFLGSSHLAYSPNGRWLAVSNDRGDHILPNGKWAPRDLQGGILLTMFAANQGPGPLVESFSMTGRNYVDLLNTYNDRFTSPSYDTQTQTHAIRFSPDGNWLITIEYLFSAINVFKVDNNTGRLTLTSLVSFKSPGDIVFSPDGQHVAVSGCAYEEAREGNLALFKFNRDSGQLKHISGSPLNTGGDEPPRAIAFSPNGNGIAVVHSSHYLKTESIVTVLKFDKATQTLTPVPGSPFAGPEGGSQSVSYSPDGQLLFVGQSNYDNIWVYEVDEFTGSLDFITGEPLLKARKKYEYAVQLLQTKNYIASVAAAMVRAYCYKKVIANESNGVH